MPPAKLNTPKAVPRRSSGAVSATSLANSPWVNAHVQAPEHDAEQHQRMVPPEGEDQVRRDEQPMPIAISPLTTEPVRDHPGRIGRERVDDVHHHQDGRDEGDRSPRPAPAGRGTPRRTAQGSARPRPPPPPRTRAGASLAPRSVSGCFLRPALMARRLLDGERR